MEISQWIGGSLMILLGGYIAVMNWIILFHQLFRNGRSSFGPLIGGVLLVLGMATLPVEGLRAWCWTGLFIDFGCAPLFLWTILFLAWMGVTHPFRRHQASQKDDDEDA